MLDECAAHAQAALRHMHERNLAALAALLDAEQWKQADVPEQVQHLADAMVASTGLQQLPAALQGHGQTGTILAVVAAAADASAASASTGVAPLLRVRGRSYHVVGTGVLLIKMLGDYSGLGEAIPDVAGHVIAATVQLLRDFNVRTTRLVLNAGALKSSAQLKRITAKHLAVTLQTLGAVLALLPSIRGALVMRLPPGEGALLEELSRVTADFMQHEQRLLGQFVSIAKDLLSKVCSDLASQPWAETSPMTIPTPPTRELIKGVAALHKILAGVLPPDQLADVFAGIDAMVAVHIPLQYSSVIARAVDAAVAAAVRSAATSSSGSDAAAILGAAAPGGAPMASRSVAAQRLAADFSVLCSSLRQLWDSAGGGGGEDDVDGDGRGGGSSSSRMGDAGEGEIQSSRAAGLASLATLQAWVVAQFENSGPPPHQQPADTKSAPVSASAAPAAAPKTLSPDESAAIVPPVGDIESPPAPSDGITRGHAVEAELPPQRPPEDDEALPPRGPAAGDVDDLLLDPLPAASDAPSASAADVVVESRPP